ncbi:oligopeptide transporter 1 [Ricinus communis]|uniref:Oligopeptide transporter, putative n=1 Tax=Ricinus communis TaxID=3988 RepID=B9S9W9_RICCO|nr:oligopeptide transporter 1 [Ricinus communis]EEF39639.1 Oligopeptide transporter, putative [Ricinus communis]|eukprot:XP_002522788.1 oligopeptide transporter 1 [Ricinus communis]
MASAKGDSIPQSRFPEKNQAHVDTKVVDDEEVDDSPVEQVRLIVPITDDPTQPVLTFRTWVLGIASCALLAYLNQFFAYRTNQLIVTSVSAQIVVLPLGNFMAAVLPKNQITIPFAKWSFSLNPGPFNMKEHALITIFASCGANGVYAVYILTSVKAFYRRPLHPAAAMLLVQTTQLLGYGWAGMFRKFLVESPYMWWPADLVQVSLFRALHEKEKRPRKGLTRLQFFAIVFVASFAYYIIPGYLFPSISALSFVCWIWKDSVLAQQIGSGLNGLGIGSFGVDWSSVASFLGSPLAVPFFAIANTMLGFVMVLYIIVPIAYWSNAFEAKKYPILSSHTFDSDGQTYNISRVLDEKNFDIDLVAYNNYSKLYLSVLFAFAYGMSFASLMSTLSHVALFEGKTIWTMWKNTKSAIKDQFTDVHTRLMRKNYEEVPEWWFLMIAVVSLVLSLIAVEGFNKQLQLPWWGLLLACAISFLFTLPVGVVQATTNMQMGLNVITELIIGYMYPGKPLANVAFKTYGYISMAQALTFIQDFKLGHYMKIPPKAMFLVQLAGTLVASTVCFGTAWWLLTTIENICIPELLPDGSPWTCPGDDVFYHASVIWGVIGPRRMFGDLGIYSKMNWFFLIGLLAPFPVWFFSQKYPEKKWIKNIHMPIFISGITGMPPAKAVHYWSWGAIGTLFNYFIYRKNKGWWARHNYILSAGLSAGVGLMGIIIFFALQSKDIYGPDWWGLDSGDHCPLAKCPTQPGIVVEGCPVAQ